MFRNMVSLAGASLNCPKHQDVQNSCSDSSMVKEKPHTVRQYDKDGYRKRAACLCIRDELENEVLLVSSSSDPLKWVVPGGGVEASETAFDAARREVLEEAGVSGFIVRCLGMFENEERKHRTVVFVLRVTNELEDWDDSKIGRRRKWFTISTARDALGPQKLLQQAYLDLLQSQLSSQLEKPVMQHHQQQQDPSSWIDFK